MDAKVERTHLQAILKTPVSDAPRLVYADLLQQEGDPRGEFIVVQCAARSSPVRATRIKARKRAEELLREHRVAWMAALELEDAVGRFSRGFLYSVEVDAKEWLEKGDEIAGNTPLRELSLRKFSMESVKSLSKLESLRGIRALRLDNSELDDDDLKTLDASPNLRALRSLGLANNELGVRAARSVANAPLGLVSLDLSRNSLGDDGAEMIAQGANWGALRSLSLYDCDIGDDGVVALTRAPFFRQLEKVSLYANRFGEAGRAALAKAGHSVAFWNLPPPVPAGGA